MTKDAILKNINIDKIIVLRDKWLKLMHVVSIKDIIIIIMYM